MRSYFVTGVVYSRGTHSTSQPPHPAAAQSYTDTPTKKTGGGALKTENKKKQPHLQPIDYQEFLVSISIQPETKRNKFPLTTFYLRLTPTIHMWITLLHKCVSIVQNIRMFEKNYFSYKIEKQWQQMTN